MSGECDLCGVSDYECKCYLYEMDKRIDFLAGELERLTYVVKEISEYIVAEELDRLTKDK